MLNYFFNKLGISKSTVSKALKRLANASSIDKNKRPGRPRLLSERGQNYVITESIKNLFKSAMEISKEYTNYSKLKISR